MMKKIFLTLGFIFSVFSFSGCGIIEEKAASMSIIYGTVAVFSFVLLAAYLVLVYKKDFWFTFLFSSVFVVNTGYYLLSVSKTLDAALWANRVSYFGSVFLPMIMLVIIMKECKINYKKWLLGVLVTVSILVFLLAASPGILDVYYKSVSLGTLNGVTVLEKVYGPLHSVYLYYLVSYFGAMVAIISYASFTKKIEKATHAILIAGSVFINICIWLFEQLVKMDFELLSVSYIMTELFLLGIHLLLQEKEEERKEKESAFIKSMIEKSAETKKSSFYIPEPKPAENESALYFNECLSSLTSTERKLLELHLSGKKTKDIMEELCITENTVKFHNKNIYRKFAVSSKKELIELCRENGIEQ